MASRSRVMPAAPVTSNAVRAIALPVCTEAIATSTRPAREPSAVRLPVTPSPATARPYGRVPTRGRPPSAAGPG